MSFVQSSMEFERCCEFSKLGDGHVIDAQKPYCVSSGNRASSFEVWTANFAQSLTQGTLTNSQFHLWRLTLEILLSQFPCGHCYKTWHSDEDIWFLIFFFLMLLFFSKEKKKKKKEYVRTVYSQTGKTTKWAETFVWCLLLIFKVVYQDPLTQLLPFAWDFAEKGQQQVWGQVG